MPACDAAFEPGDIAACWGREAASRVVSLATASLLGPAGLRWGPSHVAIITQHAGRPLWVESTTLCRRPCCVAGRPVAGVQAHRPEDRIGEYCAGGGRVELYRLMPIDSLSSTEQALLDRILIDHFLRSAAAYDLCGALLSGTRVFQLTRLFPGADLQQLFCSELIAAVLMRLGRLTRGNPTRYSPARLLRTLVQQGTYRRVGTAEVRR